MRLSISIWICLAAAQAQEAQLADLSNVLPNSPALIKSLGDAAEYVLRWKPPADAEAWRRRRPEVERAFRTAIGLDPLPERTPLNARIVSRHDLGSYAVENVIFESRPGFPVTANVYRSKQLAPGKHPAIVSPIGHFLSAGKTAAEIQARCIKLAEMGFVVLVYDAIGQGERMTLGNIHHEAGYALLPLGETIAGWMVWDTMRAIDYVTTLPDVDAERIGVTGNSGGGLNTLFTAALDPRVRAAAVAGFTFEFNNWLKYAGPHCTCTHLPGLFGAMEWFEIAGLIAPRPLLMLQGDRDNIFPISGARRAGHNAEAIYRLMQQAERARFDEVAGQPHAYSRPYRERMYGWMARHLLGTRQRRSHRRGRHPTAPRKGSAAALQSARLALRGGPGAGESHAGGGETACRGPARRGPAMGASPDGAAGSAASLSRAAWWRRLARKNLFRQRGRRVHSRTVLAPAADRAFSRRPDRRRARQARGGGIGSGPATPRKAGFAVLAVDLRGRGETLGHYGPRYDTNFRLVANQILMGQPLAGRRAFDLTRAVDYLATRKEVVSSNVTLVGLGADALPALLATVADTRISQVAAAGFLHSFISQMRAKTPDPGTRVNTSWNDAQLNGRVNAAGYSVDFGSVIPAALATADVPDIVALIAPRKVLFCQAGDTDTPGIEPLVSRFERVTASAGQSWITYAPSNFFI